MSSSKPKLVYTRPTAVATALPISQRKARSQAKAYYYLATSKTPRYSTEKLFLSVRVGAWRGEWEKTKKSAKACVPTESQRNEEKGKEKLEMKSADESDISTYTALCAGQSPIHRHPIPLLSASHTPSRATASHSPPHHPW